MSSIKSAQEELTDRIRKKLDDLDSVVASMEHRILRENDMETLARLERAKKLVSEKGRTVEIRLGEAESAEADDFAEARQALEDAWTEYREAVDRTRLEFERASELS